MKKKTLLAVFAPALIASFCLTSCGEAKDYEIEKVSNQGGSAFYEIFVSSFADSNGDGTGDLNGITSKLDYLQDLGVSYLWLTPIHPSDSYHHYDVKDYYGVASEFGTMADMENLIQKAKEHNIGIILDMVFNHASVNSAWFENFIAARRGNKAYADYYDDFAVSDTAETGYKFYSEIGKYVECRFDSSMPEFNLDTPHVVEEHKKIQKFWLDKGVAGFRYDAVAYYYYGQSTKSTAYAKILRDYCKSVKEDVYQVGEAWVNAKTAIEGYASSGMNMFNFPTSENNATSSIGNVGLMDGLASFCRTVESTQAGLKAAGVEPVYFISNHDQDRWAKYDSGKKIEDYRRKLMASCYLLTPGTPFMYYGEEIELQGVRGSEMTDAARRQAMQWGEGTDCKQPEHFTVKTQTENTVKSSLENAWTMLKHEKKVLSVRNKYKDLFRYGTYTYSATDSQNVATLNIEHNGKSYCLVHSNATKEVEVELPFSGKILEEIQVAAPRSSLSNKKLKIAAYSSLLIEKE